MLTVKSKWFVLKNLGAVLKGLTFCHSAKNIVYLILPGSGLAPKRWVHNPKWGNNPVPLTLSRAPLPRTSSSYHPLSYKLCFLFVNGRCWRIRGRLSCEETSHSTSLGDQSYTQSKANECASRCEANGCLIGTSECFGEGAS